MSHIKDVEKVMSIDIQIQIVLYGHTHNPELCFNNGITFMNPGTISKLHGFRTFGMIDVYENEYLCKMMFADLLVAG